MADVLDRLKAALADRYQIERELGSGGMATVYLAHDVKHDRKVALKVLKPELAAVIGPDRFLSEIRVAARLNHPHILPLLDSGEADGTLYFTMPIIEGLSLADRIRTEGQLGIDEIRALVTDVASALDYAHEQGIVHRDIKPDNVLIHHGKPMIADFGIALAVSQVGGDRLTETGLSLGTPQYMSPEQVSGDRTVDARSDVYALGCVVYELLVGEPPFTGPTAQAVMARQVTDPAPPIRTVRRDVPATVDVAVTKSLAKVPGDRFASVGDFATALAASEAAEPAVRAELAAAPTDARPAIAVLPFTNVGQDPANEYFADGVWEDVITNLSRVEGLRAISRTSCLRFKDTTKSMREVGEELGAGMILEGSVRRAADRVRVVVQLVDAKADEQRWAETYDRELTDIFAIQSEVALTVATALRAALSPSERERLGQRPTDDLAAYDLYLLGRHHLNKRTDEDIRQAVGHFESAIALDQRFVSAHAGLAEAYLFAGMGYAAMPQKGALPKAKAAAARAIELDSSSAEAHGTHGFVTLICDWNPDAAIAELRQAVELNPDRPEPHQWLAWCLSVQGQIAGGLESWQRALELDPLSAVVITENGWPYVYTGLDEQALEWFQRAIEIDPTFALAHYNAGWALHRLGRIGEAIPAYERGVELSGGAPFMQAFLATAFAESGRADDARRILDDLLARATHAHGMGLSIAVAAESMGDQELALDWLDRAFEERDPFLFTLALDDTWMNLPSLRDHPRFRALLDRIGIGESLPSDYRARERAKILARMKSTGESGTREPVPRSRAPASPEKPMIVVLPLTNMSTSAEDEYFSDGMTEDIIAQLSQIGSLQVISRTSAMRYKNSTETVKEIAGALGATHVVEGSVRRAGDRLRIVAQLIDASSDAHLWAQTFDRDRTDVFAIQSEVAERITGALQRQLTPDERRRFARRPTDNQDAYNAYLLARSHFNLATADGFNTAIALYRDAVVKDPLFARAWASIAVAHHWHVCGYYGMAPREAAAIIVENASRALEIDPDIAEAHMMLGEVETWTHHNWEGARLRQERALELSPNLAYAHLLYGNHLMSVGRLEDAVDVGQRALELDPAAEIAHVHANFFRYAARQYDEALIGLEAAEAQFGRKVLPLTRGETLIAVGRATEAVESFRELYDRIPVSWNQIHLAWALAAAGDESEARSVLKDIHDREAREYVWHQGIATAYAHLGEMDQAFRYLERSYEEREAWVALPFAPTFDPFRDDPRFEAIVRQIGGVEPNVDLHNGVRERPKAQPRTVPPAREGPPQ
jgi:serine/threonine-protein kinase